MTTAAGMWVTAAIGMACATGMYAISLIATGMALLGLEVINAFIPQIGTTTVVLSFSAGSKESVKKVVNQIKEDSMELYSYELKEHRTPHGTIFEASLELKVKRGNHNERLIDYMDEFDDVTISSIE